MAEGIELQRAVKRGCGEGGRAGLAGRVRLLQAPWVVVVGWASGQVVITVVQSVCHWLAQGNR